MDVTAIRNESKTKGYIFQEILPHKTNIAFSPNRKPVTNTGFIIQDTKSSISVLLERKSNKESDALFAVKLDPAVLEAQVTIDRNENQKTVLPVPKKTKDAESQRRLNFEEAMCMQRAALMSLSGQQLNLLMRYVDTLRIQRQSTQKQLECAFCKNNGQPEVWYTTHALKDGKGRVRCPVLRAFSCRRCGATGDHAHTIKYCPNK